MGNTSPADTTALQNTSDGQRQRPSWHRRGGPGRPRAAGEVPGAAPAAQGLCSHDAQRQGHQDQGHCCPDNPVQGRFVLHEDGPGKGLVAQQRHCPEVAEGIQSHQQCARGDGRPQLGQHHPEESRPWVMPQAAGAFLQGLVHAPQTRPHRDQHVRVAQEYEDQ